MLWILAIKLRVFIPYKLFWDQILP